ncbi:hypothetical protein NUW58_g5746 [Xylaria curta]|uniref:Uncharacterized protein n=1 Tax=Xylaria curta TaxID=42375 RepID=A0ACC1P053_9PEZI|nr:hypothetical protein NUW58_g5746 [Xylaria curta]
MQPSAINGRASGATRRSAPATASHNSDGGRNDSAHSDAVVGADPRARGSTSSSKRRSQQSTPPPSAAPSSELQPHDNSNANANVNANANTSTHTHTAVDNSNDQVHGNVNGKRNVAKGVESPKSTSDASSPGSSKASNGL